MTNDIHLAINISKRNNLHSVALEEVVDAFPNLENHASTVDTDDGGVFLDKQTVFAHLPVDGVHGGYL